MPNIPMLFLPQINPCDFEFNPSKKGFLVVYTDAYRSFVGRPPRDLTIESFGTFRDGPRMQSKEHLIEILQGA